MSPEHDKSPIGLDSNRTAPLATYMRGDDPILELAGRSEKIQHSGV